MGRLRAETNLTVASPSRARRVAVGAMFSSTLAIAAAYGSAFLSGGSPAWATWLFVGGTACLMVGAMVLGAARPGRRLGPVLLAFAFIWIVIVGGFSVVLLLPATDSAVSALWLGLPPRAAVIVYGIGLLPVLVLPLAYALTFDSLTLSEADLERVRAASRSGGPS